jgi:hypothetical protein
LLLMVVTAAMAAPCGAPIARPLSLRVLRMRAVAPESRALLGRLRAACCTGPALLRSWLGSLRANIRVRLGRILYAGKRTGPEGQGSSETRAPKPILDAFFHEFPRGIYTPPGQQRGNSGNSESARR